MSNAKQIAEALGSTKSTPEGYLCKCPCHEDKTSSLSIKDTDKGVIVNCFAGCSWETIKQELEGRGILDKPRPRTMDHGSPKKKRYNKYEGAIFFTYKDLVGNILCRKVKMPNKKQWFERLDGKDYKNGLEGMQVPLYNIENVIKSDTIYLCEGEKDAETLMVHGLCGTTNHAGATSFKPYLAEYLKGKTVVIIPDNDEAGKKRVAIVSKCLQNHVKELRVFIPEGVQEKGDITDWVQLGNKTEDIFPKSISVQKKKAPKHATRTEYFELFDQVLGDPKRCIFNEKLMNHDPETNLWNPCINSLEIIKSEALTANESRESKFTTGSIQPHFFAYESTKPLEFLVDIPEWDGEDRIDAMCTLMSLRESGEVDEWAMYELIKEWCSRVFIRLKDPYEQNRILILQGVQNAGKDTWIHMLLGGLGQFMIPLSIISGDKDTFLSLHRGLVMNISEFDKTAKTEVSILKDIITLPSTDLRAAYAKDSKVRMSRCSFISSANADNLLRDWTGNRRFMIFEIDDIQYAYEGWSKQKIRDWQMQCLSQMKHLSEIDYKASPKAWTQMHEYIDRKTPTDPSDDMVDHFISLLREDIEYKGGHSYVDLEITNRLVSEVILKLSKETGVRTRGVKSMLQNRIGVYKRVGGKRFWALRVPPLTIDHPSENGVPEETITLQGLMDHGIKDDF